MSNRRKRDDSIEYTNKTLKTMDDIDGHLNIQTNTFLNQECTIQAHIDFILKQLGQGTFGKVVEGINKDGKPCAIKIIKAIPKYTHAAKQEIYVLKTLSKNDPHKRWYPLG
jgi:dual-specificity kinase